MPQPDQSQHDFAGSGRAAARHIVLEIVGDHGQQIDEDGHPHHVQLEVDAEEPPAVEHPAQSQHVHTVSLSLALIPKQLLLNSSVSLRYLGVDELPKQEVMFLHIYNIISVLMLPYIGAQPAKRKPGFAGTEEPVKEWTEIKKELEARAKLSALKIMTPVMSDFNKICKLKQIPDFYCQYLFLFLEKLTDQQAGEALSAEIRQIINHRSHYHKISDTLDERASILKAVESRLEIAEGFQDMNTGKSIKASVKNKINDMIKQATSLEDIKALQKQSICDLATEIIKLRANSMQIVGYAKMWREKLTSISDKRIKFKIVFPFNGFNCVLLPLFDQGFIFNSFLARQLNIKEANNPFLVFSKESRKKSEFQNIYRTQMAKDFINYEIKTNEILTQFPGKEDTSKVDKQIDDKKKQKQELKAKWENQIKYRSNKEPKQSEKDKLPKKKSVQSIIDPKNVLDIEAILLKHKSRNKNKLNNSNQESSIINKDSNNEASPVGSPKIKKNQKILGVYGKGKLNESTPENNKIQLILNEKAALQRELKEANKKNKQFEKILKKIEPKEANNSKKNDKPNSSHIEPHQLKNSVNRSRADFHNKVEAVYKTQNRKLNNRTDRKLGELQVSVEDIMNEKKSLEKELKGQIKQKLKLQKLIKKSETDIDKQVETNKTERLKLQQRVKYLESKLSNYNDDSPLGKKEPTLLLQKSKVSVASIYTNQLPTDKRASPSLNLYESKLIEQKQQRKSLQKQMKDLAKQKNKLEHTIEKSHQMMVKEKQLLDKKMQKYEETINKLKQEKALQKSLKNSQTMPARKKSQSLRMYTATALKQEEVKRQKKQSSHIQSANYFKLPPEIKRVNVKPKILSEIEDQQEKHEKNVVVSKSINKVEIIQTKKTIQIVYKRSSKSKNKSEETEKVKDSVEQDENKNALQRVVKEKNSLLFQLQREEAKREQQMKAKIRKAQRDGDEIAKYKEAIERQRNKKYELENKIKKLQKDLYDQFEQKMKAEKMKFQQQKKELIANIQNEKNERELRDKYLNNQIKFLKEMESNEKQLMQLLEMQKRGRLEKQRELQAEIAKKQELLQIIELEEIKKGLQSEIRKQIQQGITEQSDDGIDIEEKKDQLRIQIEQLHNEKQEQLEQIDEQNQKLKNLISRIKVEEGKLITAIKENIKEDEEQQEENGPLATEQEQSPNLAMTSTELRPEKLQLDRDYHSDAEESKLKQSKVTKKQAKEGQEQLKQEEVDLKQAEMIFQSRLRSQEQHEENMKSAFKKIRESPEYREKEEVENLIEMYLQNPHQYPSSKTRNYSPQEKTDIKQEVLKKSRLAGQFEHELLQLKQVQKFVPTADDDIMTSHLLSLKRVYEQKQSSALKQQLFPAIVQNEEANERELSFESDETPPPVTIDEHVKLHAKKFPIKKNDGKNFLAINRMRLAMQEEDRKEKQKHLIEEQARRRAREQVLKKQLRAREEQRYQKSLQKKKAFQQELSQKNSRVHQITSQLLQKKKSLKRQGKIEQDKKSSIMSIQGAAKNDSYKQKLENIQDQQPDDHQLHEQQRDEQKQPSQKEVEGEDQNLNESNQDDRQPDFDSNYLEITNKHSSLERERKELEDDVHRYQDEIRSYVSREDKYDIYQQFVESADIDSYVKNLHSISSDEVRGLNSNNTILKDIPTYRSIVILIAKDKTKEVEVGIGVFHKEYHESLYICDYVVAHNMRNFLNLVFNFSRYIFKLDSFTNKIEYYFNLSQLEDEISIINFIQFEEKCKRMGQVYVKVGADKTRKYALRRNLFEPADREFQKESQGIEMQVSLLIHSDHLRQQGYGFENKRAIEHFSSTALLAMYMKRNQEVLEVFRKNTEDDLKYRELLITTLMFQKKEVDLKNFETSEYGIEERLQLSKQLMGKFIIEDPTHAVQQMQLSVCNSLSQKTKRCTFSIEGEDTNYIIHYPEEALTKIQSSNSSEVGYFINLIPKYKVLVMEAGEFLSMNKANPEVNTFFYVKHFIKNVVEVTKEEYFKVFVPEVEMESEVFLKDFSDQIKQAMFAKENIKIGWDKSFSNSIIFSPSHKDLVIKKPYIISLLSATVERAIEGTPLVATLVQ